MPKKKRSIPLGVSYCHTLISNSFTHLLILHSDSNTLEELNHKSLSSQLLSSLSFALRCRPVGAPNRPRQITHFYTITSRSLPAHGWVQVSPVCLPLCAYFSPIICSNKCAMGRVTFTLIVCTQRGSLPPHHGSKVSSIVSNFLFPFLATVCCFFTLSQPHEQFRASD